MARLTHIQMESLRILSDNWPGNIAANTKKALVKKGLVIENGGKLKLTEQGKMVSEAYRQGVRSVSFWRNLNR